MYSLALGLLIGLTFGFIWHSLDNWLSVRKASVYSRQGYLHILRGNLLMAVICAVALLGMITL
jgi:hypothetical protein